MYRLLINPLKMWTKLRYFGMSLTNQYYIQQINFRLCLLPWSSESLVLPFAVRKYKNQSIWKNNVVYYFVCEVAEKAKTFK
jgi:hypothetical protein